ncbi:hypothetical protein OPFAMLBM_00050 [Aeromonas phage avDM12-TAAL]|nr:hypothetical protein OPFAMLBM_00050 [Aeromonas phage avDM12-TAAL]
MKIHQEQTEIYGSAADQSSGFKILASAKAFKILSSSLYKYKQRAIIRELCCNAVDGHIALKRTGVEVSKTFDVTLPSMLNQQFSVRDYGIGLSEEDVTGLYCTYFASTKSNSNDEIGGFGLGCKSPFAYTDTFTVTSWFGGKKMIFSAFMKNGEPNIMKMYEEDSSEHTGVEVTVPVSNDMNTWEAEAKRVFCSFGEYRPRFIGKPITVNYLEFDKDGICKIDGNYYSQHGNGVFAVMGGVVYPIPAEYWNNTMIGLYAARKTYYVRFEIGELDMTPSREELSLDPDTIASINKRMKLLNKVHEVEIDDAFKKCKDIRELHSHMMGRFPSEVWQRMIQKRVFRKKTIEQWKAQLSSYTRPNADVPIVRASVGAGTVRKVKQRWSNGVDISFGSSFRPVIINDLKTGAAEVMYGLDRLNKFRVEGAFVFDVFSNVKVDEKDPKSTTVGKANRENMVEYLKYFPTRMKDGKVILLSKVRAEVLKEMKDKGFIQPKKRTGKATNVVKYENGVTSEVQMYVEDIDDLKDVIWCAHEYGYLKIATPTITTETLKNGKTREKYDNWKTVTTFNDRIIKTWSKLEGKTVYVFKSQHWARADKNKNIEQFNESMVTDYVVDQMDKVTMDHFGVTVNERWINRLASNPITKPLTDDLCGHNGQRSDIGEFLLLVRDSRSDLKDAKQRTLNEVVSKLVKEATDRAYAKVREFEKNNPLIIGYLNQIYDLKDAIAKNIVEVAK